jgi:hypothetical protein
LVADKTNGERRNGPLRAKIAGHSIGVVVDRRLVEGIDLPRLRHSSGGADLLGYLLEALPGGASIRAAGFSSMRRARTFGQQSGQPATSSARSNGWPSIPMEGGLAVDQDDQRMLGEELMREIDAMIDGYGLDRLTACAIVADRVRVDAEWLNNLRFRAWMRARGVALDTTEAED